MTGGIFLIQKEGEKLVEMKEKEYDSEDLLQKLLEKYPNLISGEQIDSKDPRRWLLITREAQLKSDEGGDLWFIDHLFIDQDGIPTIIEVKRSSDTRIRREVVGQMLDYAANAVVYWPVETVKAQFEAKYKGQNYSEVIKKALGPEIDENQLWQNVKLNLQAERIRMIFVADKIPVELKRVVEFLNGQMSRAEVLAFEIPQYEADGLQALVPKIIGQTSRRIDPFESEPWDPVTFIKELTSRRNKEEVDVAQKIMKYSEGKSLRLAFGKGKVDGSVTPVLDYKGNSHWMLTIWTYGSIGIQFKSMAVRQPFAQESKREELLNKLNAIKGINISKDYINSWPSFPLSALTNEIAYNQFKEIMDWYYNEVIKANS